MLTISKQAKLGIPPAFSERCVVRCQGVEFGLSKKDKPMITVDWELIGYFDEAGKLQQEMERGDKVFKLAGLKVGKSYFTLTDKAVSFYADFYQMATGTELTELDETNPDIEYMKDNLAMQAIVTGTNSVFRKQLTPEEREKLIEDGKEPVGEPILDEDGNEIQTPQLSVRRWLKKYTGEIEPF